ncbi:hydrogenase maturation protease [Ammoniphilus sp. CFH 90114]|uniref:hydrogenase maturation protease n=1 Tax=Ammoniphilus sp. CFH 90114 TaxID=2493665 RepID=UPI00100E5447|nr:hydrogenase maturation protease [Ammoniphilus sp. CFH 90114]RXT07947.1 hydrogenase maturation protease [Ammoniphilus sp. CFH 90114]
MKILVLGLGNRLMKDDGIGVELVEALLNEKYMDKEIEYAVGETDLNYCLDVIENRQYIIVIDAVMMGKQPGEASVLPLSELVRSKPGLSMHHLHFLDLLHQFGERKQGMLIGIEPFELDFHLGLSKGLKEQFKRILNDVMSILNQYKSN